MRELVSVGPLPLTCPRVGTGLSRHSARQNHTARQNNELAQYRHFRTTNALEATSSSCLWRVYPSESSISRSSHVHLPQEDSRSVPVPRAQSGTPNEPLFRPEEDSQSPPVPRVQSGTSSWPSFLPAGGLSEPSRSSSHLFAVMYSGCYLGLSRHQA